MKRHLNTLFVMTQGAYLRKDHESVVVSVDREEKLRVPIHNLGSVVCFGNIMVSPFLLGHCAENRVGVSFLTERGHFLARVQGSAHGNVLLRRAQYKAADDPIRACGVARSVVTGKVWNARRQLRRLCSSDGVSDESRADVRNVANKLDDVLRRLRGAECTDTIRGYEGEASRLYFGVFDRFLRSSDAAFTFNGRSRRPPRDRVNAMLSFTYTIMRHDVESSLETVGLDPQVGFLHADRPGRPGLALDMMEEFRPWLADRVCLSLINRRQVSSADFDPQPAGAVLMNERSRKTLLTAYQERKQEEVFHPFLEERVSIGLLFFVQALLLSRFLRGDLDEYPPFFAK